MIRAEAAKIDELRNRSTGRVILRGTMPTTARARSHPPLASLLCRWLPGVTRRHVKMEAQGLKARCEPG